MKKIIALAMVLAMFALLVACDTSSGDLTSINDYVAPNYTVTTDTGIFTYEEGEGNAVTIVKYVGKAEPHDVVVPEKIIVKSNDEHSTNEDNERIVTAIGANAFYYCTAMTSITLPKTVESIGSWAFAGCTGLTQVELPDAIKTIGAGAFHGCTELTSIKLSSELVEIKEHAFYGCKKLAAVNFPSKLEIIGTAAFFGCQSLTELTIPASVNAIGDMAFYQCNHLTSIDMSAMSTEKDSVLLGDYIFWSEYKDMIQAPAEGPVKEYVDKIVISGVGEEETTKGTETTPEEETTEAAE
ncbi:MAG: leucine-rich repeat domain-containing protein [Clostridia bacterium]|nr:leucine-rich repeat domain-containing protein [Clostridia bacterium]MBR5881159.1 leucine-rich repeat domain-containing protein [Clostridia bacterium]